MTKYGLRARVYILTLLPTLIIGILLASYFSFNRNQQLNNSVIEQGVNVIEPLAIAAELGLSRRNRDMVKSLISVTHRKLSPLAESIAVYDKNNQLFATSNYHRDLRLLQSDPALPLPELTQVQSFRDRIVIRTPIWAETRGSFAAINHGAPELLGYIALQFNRDRAQLLQFRDTIVALLIVLLGAFISLIFAFLLTKHVTAPITNMVRIVDKIRQGRLDARVSGKLTGELGLLKNGINAMAKSLAEYHEEMHQSIDQATSDLRETLEQIEIQNIELDIAKKEAQQGAKAKSEFLANMSHELRTPLNGVIGFARQLLKTPLDVNQVDYLSTIEKSANNLLAIINDILDLSKLEAGKLKLERIDYNFRDTLCDVMTLLGPSAHQKNLELNLIIDPQVPEGLKGDPLRLQQVITNLLGNAIKFTQQGRIDVEVIQKQSRASHRHLYFSVRDSGIGISPEQQNMLFQAFKQADASISREYGGTGLGLVITQKLVQQMGGNIQINSQLGKGSEFSFSIDVELADIVMGESINTDALKDQRIVLFEPQTVSRRAFLSLSEHYDIPLISVHEKHELLRELATPCDVLLLGHGDWSKLEPLAQLIAEVKGQCAQLMVMINSSDPEIHQQILHAGGDQCLVKPINHRKFIAQLLHPVEKTKTVPSHVMSTKTTPRLSMKVLAVDDNEANLKLITAILGELVDDIDTAENGQQALSMAQAKHYDIIFMDVQMPILDGIAATAQIRKQSLNAVTPIIAVTAHALGSEKESLLKQGFNAYLAKPIDEDALIRSLEQWHSEQPRNLQVFVEAESPSFSWVSALQRSNNRPELALEMLSMLIDNFEGLMKEIDAALEGSIDANKLAATIHRFHGGCAYTGCQRLQALSATIETGLKEGQGIDELEPELFEIVDEMNGILAQLDGAQRPNQALFLS